MKQNVRVLIRMLCIALLPALAFARPLDVADYLNWEEVASPQISPDGKTIVYTRTRMDAQEDRKVSSFWIMDSDGRRNRYFMDGQEAQWSPDGQRLAVVKTVNGGLEIFVRWMDGTREATQITYSGLYPTNIRWSPDGKWISFRGIVPMQPTWGIGLPPRPPGARWVEEPAVIDKLHYRSDGFGLSEVYRHLFIVSAEGGTPRQLTSGDWSVGAAFAGKDIFDTPEWTPDGKSIVFSGDMAEDANQQHVRSSIYAVDVTSGATRRIVSEPGFWAGPTVSPDGKFVAFGGHPDINEVYPGRQLRLIGIDGKDSRTLIEDLPGENSYMTWGSDGRGLYYVVESEGSNNLHYVSLDGKTRPVTAGAHSLLVSSISSNGIVAGTSKDPLRPEDLVRFDLRSPRKVQYLTAVNEDALRDVELGRTEEIWFESSERTRVQGWIVTPPGFDPAKKYPLVLTIHGGPHGMFDVGFFFNRQVMAAQGYVVLFINPRGSTGYGRAFANAIDNAFPGERDRDDLLAGVDAVVKRGFIDTQRLYVSGCSAGGTLTNWLVTQTDRFAAAGSMCSVSNMISFAGTTDIVMWAYARFRPAFWQDPQLWLRHSPIMYADKVKTPTLLITGGDDLRTPVGQAEEFYTALKLNNVPTKLIVLKSQAHGTGARPSNLIRTQLFLYKWFSQWRRVESAEGAAWTAAAAP